MNPRPLAVALLLVLSAVTPALAQDALTPVLLGGSDPAAVRGGLIAFATRANPADSVVAAEAWDLAALSCHRAGDADSAIVCWRHALERHATGAVADALIDALQKRRRAEDLAAADALIARRFRMMRFDAGPMDQANTAGRLAWSLFLAGRADSARRAFARVPRLLDAGNPMAWVWRRRIAMVAHGAGDRDRALEMCKDLAVRSLLQDREVMTLLGDVLGGEQGAERYAPFLRAELVHAQQDDRTRLAAAGASRIATTGIDGFPLSVVLFGPPPRARRAVIAIATDADDYPRYDSLAAALGRAGWALGVLDARGSGRSLGPACASPESWDGREEAMESAVAGDVRRAFTAVAREARLDSTAYVVLGSLGTTSIAVEAMTLDPRVKALLLLSPLPPPVELGRMAARLKRHRIPAFIETAPTDIGSGDDGAALYEALDPHTSRLVDSEATGSGPAVFRSDGTAAPRLMGWLAERFAARPAPRRAARRPR